MGRVLQAVAVNNGEGKESDNCQAPVGAWF